MLKTCGLQFLSELHLYLGKNVDAFEVKAKKMRALTCLELWRFRTYRDV